MSGRGDSSAKAYCCATWQSLCFWGCAFVVIYAACLAGVYWLHLEKYGLSALFVALGLACGVNFARNRNFHCVITGPFFLLIALAFGLDTAGVWAIPTGALWTIVVIVVCAALLVEQRVAS
jgi:hypothetical protein